MALWAARQPLLHDFPARHADTPIRTDAEGRYCLNDLHRASGGNPSHAPGQWLRNKQTQDLVAEMTDVQISTSPPIASIRGGDGAQGTFVAKELVYAYAMWISPAFHLRVIRAYDAMLTQQSRDAVAVPQTLPEALRLSADLPEPRTLAIITHRTLGLPSCHFACSGPSCW